MTDLIIIGAGPAGLTASIYAKRYNLQTLLLGEVMGGLLTQNWVIENYPGVPAVPAFELANRMLDQAKSFGIEWKHTTVTAVKKITDGSFEVSCGADKCLSKAIIIAAGTERRKLGVPGEAELTGKGVSYCSTCDGNFFKGKEVAVVGGGDSAIRAVLDLSDIAGKVYLIHRRAEFKAKPEFVEMAKAKKNVEFILNANVLVCLHDLPVETGHAPSLHNKPAVLRGIKLDKQINGSDILPLNGLFIEIGGIPSTKFADQLGLSKNEMGFIQVNENMETSVPGVFAAGDITTGYGGMQQIVVATAEGAVAARSAYRFVSSLVKK